MLSARARQARTPAAATGVSPDAHQSLADRVYHEFRRIVDADGLHDVGAMNGDGVSAQTEHRRDLFVGLSVNDELQHLELACGQLRRCLPRGFAERTQAR